MYVGKHLKKEPSGKGGKAQILVFLIFIGALFLLHLILPDRSFSEQENRSLQTLPRFSLTSLFSGRFASQFESYMNDQFPFRDAWITMKAGSELASGKDSNNGIYLCEGETLLECFTAPEGGIPASNVAAVRTLAEQTENAAVYFALIPTAAEIHRELLPSGAPNDSQREVIDRSYADAGCTAVDMYGALESHAAEPVYYRTDHHWTTLGAYYGYTALARTMGFSPVPLEQYRERVVTENFYGTSYSASGFSWVAPDRISTYVEQGDVSITNYPQGVALPGALYDESYLIKKDKYSYFYGGNTPLLTIETGNAGPKLLILRDSYMDSLSPYLFPHFSEIHILDLRYYRTSLKDYISEQGFDDILVCYSVTNFCTDQNIFLMAY